MLLKLLVLQLPLTSKLLNSKCKRVIFGWKSALHNKVRYQTSNRFLFWITKAFVAFKSYCTVDMKALVNVKRRSDVFSTLCLGSAWLRADGVSAEYTLWREDLHAVESSQRDQWSHHTLRGQSATSNNDQTLCQLYLVMVKVLAEYWAAGTPVQSAAIQDKTSPIKTPF